MKKQIWKAKVTQEIEWKEWFSKRPQQFTFDYYLDEYRLALTEQDAVTMFLSTNNISEVSDWHVVYFSLPKKFNVINSSIKVESVIPTLDKLKKNMYADEFLQYCRQELFPTLDISDII